MLRPWAQAAFRKLERQMSKMENATFAATKCDISPPDPPKTTVTGGDRVETALKWAMFETGKAWENGGTHTEKFGGINISWDNIMTIYDIILWLMVYIFCTPSNISWCQDIAWVLP